MAAARKAVVSGDKTPLLMPYFSRYIGIDYSGAQSPENHLTGLRIYAATPEEEPEEILPLGQKKYWSRRGVAEWLVEQLRDGPPTILGIDHGFSFPLDYFHVHGLPHDWEHFLDDFCHHWPAHVGTVDEIRRHERGHGAARGGSSRWRRMTEKRSRSAKSVFHFDVPGSVAKSTFAGLPWLKFLRDELGDMLHCWPFDGWIPAAEKSVVLEAYPSLWSRGYPRGNRTPDQHDAYSIARWIRESDTHGSLIGHFQTTLTEEEKAVAQIEGWILSV